MALVFRRLVGRTGTLMGFPLVGVGLVGVSLGIGFVVRGTRGPDGTEILRRHYESLQ